MSADQPVASIIVPSYRGVARLPALLDSLAAQETGSPAFEVIVVIDGIDDGSVALVEAEDRVDTRHILFPENRGRVAALNAGLDAARGDVLIRCDDDLVVPPGYVSGHVRSHGGADPVAVVGPTIDVHDGSAYARAYGEDAAHRSHDFQLTRPADQTWRLWAASCSVDRATAERIGGYDPRYRAYGWEDVDYGYRLHAVGIPIIVEPAVTAEHHGPARSASARASKAYASGEARALFAELHPEAPLAAPSPGGGLWGGLVRASAEAQSSASRRRVVGAAVDALVRVAPAPVAEKLVAGLVEGAGFAGIRSHATSQQAGAAPAQATAPAGGPRIAIAHDYLTQRGGAERVVLSLCRAFPDAEVHTLFYNPDQTYPEFRDRVIRTSPLNRIGAFRRDPRLALPLLAPFASRMRIDADVVIASSSGWAHAFPTRGRKIVYCHSPARWLYLPDDYLGDAKPWDPKRLALTVLTPFLRRWDHRAARTADQYLANSSVVRERIARVYGIDAPTLFPPFSPDVAEGAQDPIGQLAGWAGEDGTEGGHYLVVSRLQPYKHVDRVIEAFRSMPDKRLLVIGKGPERDRLHAMAPSNVRLVEGLTDAQMRWAYGNARALIAASHEDFGLTPLEAGAHGVPVIALRAGGYLDTIREGVNGVFFEAAEPHAIARAVRALDIAALEEARTRAHASEFAEASFIKSLQARLITDSRGRKQ